MGWGSFRRSVFLFPVFFVLKGFEVRESRKNSKTFDKENTDGAEERKRRAVVCASRQSPGRS